MLRKVSPLLLTAQAAALIALAGCGQPSPVETPPNTYQEEPQRPPPPPPPLAGGPATGPYEMPVGSGLAPNPEDSPSSTGLQTWREPDGRLVTAMAPIPDADETARTEPMRTDDLRGERRRDRPQARLAAAEPLRRVPAPPPPKTVAPPPAPLKARPAAPPSTLSTTTSPTLKTVQTPAARLTAELTPVIAAGAKLSVPEAIAAGDPAAVTLTLPADFLGTVQAEANALDLRRAARAVQVTAALSGDGYDVTPNGPQTLALKPGEPASFTWQVTPRALKAKPLTAKIDAALTGGRSPFDFALGSVEAPVAGAESASAGGLDGMINAPGLGPLPARTLLGGGLIALAVIVLAFLARRASAWESAAARRRAQRAEKD
ncbi:MAG: hypothetical protein BGN86_12045 [Caulobacterales bacterium 68-7]|nr:hypothetical protein [Caulobacterales bacterium]OJU12418.1 MAG: hypothetical protein BGN86_12045 [Caulobacterales bacterium 68-7]